MKKTTDKKKKLNLTQQLEESNRLLAIANNTVKQQIDMLKEKDREIDEVYKLKSKEMLDILYMIGRPFGLQKDKMVKAMFGGMEPKSKEVPELAGELAGQMGQLLEEKRIADARYQEKENEVRWLRWIVESVIPTKMVPKKKLEDVIKGWDKQADNLMNGLDKNAE